MPYIGGDPNRSALPVETADITDDQITLAKLASGTDGNIISYDASGNPVAIATGDDGEVLTSAGAGAQPAFEAAASGGGITHASQWRLTTNFDGDAAPIASNLEEVDAPSDGPFGTLGASMSESSGIFTFPATGFWYVMFLCTYYYAGHSTYTDAQISGTNDNSSYGTLTYGRSGTNSDGPNYANIATDYVCDIQNTSTHKVQFMVKTEDDSATCKGASGYNYTSMTFIRLGDT
jgi:hypothetical protein